MQNVQLLTGDETDGVTTDTYCQRGGGTAKSHITMKDGGGKEDGITTRRGRPR